MIRRITEKINYEIGKKKNRELEHNWQQKLTNDNFSIICSNCIGGIIYNRLGKEFLSPTINMYFTQSDFIKFAVNLQYYINLDLEFIKTEKPHPVAKLDDITLYFNHSDSEKSAAEDWNRRKVRINYDNIYIIFYYRDGYSVEQLHEIEKAQYRNVILLTNTELDIEYAHYIKENVGQINSESFLDKDKYGIHTFEKEWDFVAWINSNVN